MTMTKPFLRTTTALVMMASMTLPAVAQGLDGMTPKDILKGARDGSLDVGFETDGMNREQLVAELARLQALCEAGEASEGANCDRIVELPDAAALAGGNGALGTAVEDAQAEGNGQTQEMSAEVDATAEAEAQDAPAEASVAEAETAESEGTDELREALEEAEAQDAPSEAPSAEAQTAQSEEAGAPSEAPEAAEASDAPAEAPVTEAETAGTEGTDELREALEEAEAQDASAEAPVAEAETPATEGNESPEDAEAQEALAQEPVAEAEPQTDTASDETTEVQAGAETEEPSLQAEPEEVSDQEQADAAARLSQQLGAAAAALGLAEAGEPEVVEEEVSDADVRSSDEDFGTRIGEALQQARDGVAERDRDSADDNDRNDTLRNLGTAAIAGLGAVALSKFLSDDAKVVENTGDRLVVEENGQYRVLRNDDVLLRRPGSDVTTYRYDDGSTRTVVQYEDGNAVETVKAADGRVLRRIRTLPDGEQIVLFDDTQAEQQVVVNDLPQTQETPRRMNIREVDEAELAAALAAENGTDVGRTFSLNQIRNIDTVRHLVPEISVDSINFETGSAAIRPQEAQALAALGNAMKRVISDNPGEVFLIEGHTDATGGWGYNLALSDRRAESVALALTEYFDVPPENMVLQGYGESDLAIETQTSERANRRAAVRRITPLLQGS